MNSDKCIGRVILTQIILMALLSTNICRANENNTVSIQSFSTAKQISKNQRGYLEVSNEKDVYSITSNGTCENERTKKRFVLTTEGGNIVKLQYVFLGEDPIILYTIENRSQDMIGSSLARIDSINQNIKWTTTSGANPKAGMAKDGRLYIGGAGRLGKVDVESGKYLWEHADLHEKSMSFNIIEAKKIINGNVQFIAGSGIPRAQDEVSLTVDDSSGKIVGIDLSKGLKGRRRR